VSEQSDGKAARAAPKSHRLSSLEGLLGWARRASMAPYPFVTGCCAVEVDAAMGPRGDLGELGGWPPQSSPEHADVLIVGGVVNARQVPVIRSVYERMAAPKWVLVVGDCAGKGAIGSAYAELRAVEDFLPVDVVVPGCPPRPEAIVDGLLALRSKVGDEPTPEPSRSRRGSEKKRKKRARGE